MSILRRLGQAAVAVPFISLGWRTIVDPGPRVEAAETLGLPGTKGLVAVTGVAMVVGGISLVLDVLPRVAAGGLAVALVPTTVAGHRFWEEEDPDVRAAKQTHFVKNVGLVGGLLVLASGRGPATGQ